MKVFLSWSGERSRRVAEALRDWLPDIIQSIKPWMSATDIEAGSRWSRELWDQLAETQVGILCLTTSNQQSPWMLFEAGALAKSLANTFVCPYLIGMDQNDIKPGPLVQFQTKRADENGTWELLKTLNRA
jgi:hypothetical protein